MPAATDHHFITLASNSLSLDAARHRALNALRKRGVFDPPGNAQIVMPSGQAMTFDNLVWRTATDGIVPELDMGDWMESEPFISIAISFAGSSSPTMQIGYASRQAPVPHGASYQTNDVLNDVLEDVLFHRDAVSSLSVFSKSDGFRGTFRSYRAFLSACITAIDVFMNRAAWFARRQPSHLSRAQRSLLQDRRVSITRKLTEWLPLISPGAKIDPNGKPLARMNDLRNARNGYVHVNEPDYHFEVTKAAEALNMCRQGVGQLLIDLATAIGATPHPKAIAVRHARTAQFVPFTDK